jgi:hypothetical protein
MDGARWDFANGNNESLLNTPVKLGDDGDNEQSFNSYQETSFDSEGFGQKVAGKGSWKKRLKLLGTNSSVCFIISSEMTFILFLVFPHLTLHYTTTDFRVELTRLESTAAVPTTPTTTRHHQYGSDGSNTTQPTTPASASKFIERSLHDLDDLINQRRLELSELKKTNRQRLEATPAPVTSGGISRGNAGFGQMEMSPAVVSLSRAAYDELKDSERSLQLQLKSEQLRSKQLEDDVIDMESQCAAHAERAKAAMTEKNRYKRCDMNRRRE